MKKILATAVLTTSLFAEVGTILPFVGSINYGDDRATSIKDKSTIFGANMSVGDLDYLLEASYAHIGTVYKDTNVEDLKQDDITLIYGQYYLDKMFKIGAHYTSTNDQQLKDGFTALAGVAVYQNYGRDKATLGVDAYYSYYKEGHNENYIATSVAITQVSPYVTYYNSINADWGNTITVKANFQNTADYVQENYASYEISDTLSYQSVFATVSAYTGEMRTGVKDGGMSVYNTLDLLKNGYSVQLGYYLNKDAILSLSYAENTYREFDQSFVSITGDNKNAIALASFNYSF